MDPSTLDVSSEACSPAVQRSLRPDGSWRPRPTIYKGIAMRSRLEALWAAYFEDLSWPWPDWMPADEWWEPTTPEQVAWVERVFASVDGF